MFEVQTLNVDDGREAAAVETRPDQSSHPLIDPKSGLAWWLGELTLAAVVVAVSVALGAKTRHETAVGVLDEGAHYDYVLAVRKGHIPAWGDPSDQRTLRLIDCVGSWGRPKSGCDVRFRDPATYPAKGFSYEAQQPPLGYLPYLLSVRPNADPAHVLVDARDGGAAWTAVAAVLLLAIATLEGLSLVAFSVLLSTCLLCPVHVIAAATVNNDAAGVAAGALAFLVVLVSRRWVGRSPVWAVLAGAATGLIIGLIKGHYAIAPMVLVVAALTGERPWTSLP